MNSIIKVTSGLVGLKLGLVITRLAFTYIRAPILGAIAVFKSLRLGVSLVGTALKTAFMFSPIKSIFMLGTAAYFVVTNWKSVKEFFGTIWEGVFPYWQKFKEIMSDLGITQFIIDSWNNVSVIFKALWEPVKPLWDNFQSRIDELGITSKLLASWQKVKDFFESFITNISKKWESFKNSISSFVGKDSFIGKTISGTKNFVTSVVGQDNLNKIGESVSKFKNSVSSFFSYFNDKQPMANKLQQSNNHSSVNDNRNYTINVTVPEGASGQQIANLVKDSVYSAPTYSGVLYDKFAY